MILSSDGHYLRTFYLNILHVVLDMRWNLVCLRLKLTILYIVKIHLNFMPKEWTIFIRNLFGHTERKVLITYYGYIFFPR